MIRRNSTRLIAILSLAFIILLTLSTIGLLGYRNYAPVKPFLVYYGELPTTIRDVPAFVKRLQGYPVVIIGDGLSSPIIASDIIRLGHRTPHPIRFYGYISIGVTHQAGNYSVKQVQSLLLHWKKIGVYGILYDTAGPDFGVSHQRLMKLIQLAHRIGLYVIVNSWFPQAVMNVGLTANDGYLAENWYVSSGEIRSIPEGVTYVKQLRDHGIPIYMTATGGNRIDTIHQAEIRAWIAGSKKVAGGQYIDISDENYSADTDYIEPATIIHKLIQSFFPFGL